MSEPDASSIVKGITYLDFDPDVSSSPIAVGVNSSRIEKVLSADYGNSLATAISSIGATPVTLVVKEDCNVSASATVPDNIFLEFRNAAKLIKTSSGSIEFEGLGVLNADTQIPYFEDFDPGDVIWTGGISPARVSTEIIDTGNDSLSDRVAWVEAAFDGQAVCFICYPRTITTSVEIGEFHELYFMAGDFPNTLNVASTSGNGAFILNSNTRITGSSLARIHETDETNSGIFAQPVSLYDVLENIIVEGLYFVGSAIALNTGGAASTIILGNASNSAIRNCIFDGTHYFNVIGGYGTTGNYAENCEISNNKFLRADTQICAVINGKNIRISDNLFTVAVTAGGSGFALIDIEVNNVEDVVENIVIENNTFDFRNGSTDYSHVGLAVMVQAGQDGSSKNITVRNNTIYGREIIPIPGNLSPLTTGIYFIGVMEGYVYGNTVRSGFQAGGMIVRGGRYLRIYDNDFTQCSDVTGQHWQLTLFAVSDSDIYYNNISKTQGIGSQSAGMFEAEEEYTVTVSGTTITNLQTLTLRFFDYFVGLTVTINDTDYVISSFTSHTVIDAASSIGNLAQNTFTNANVNTGTDLITINLHGYSTGDGLRLTNSGGAVPTGLTVDTTYYVIRVSNNTLKLAATRALALANTPIDLTAGGSGTNTLTPVMRTKFSNNTFRSNKTADGITLEPTGSSVISSDYLRTVSDFFAPAQITANQNDYNPGRSAFRLDLSTNASRNITGLVFTMTQINGEKHVIYNAGSNDIVLKNQDAGSTAANRFKNSTGADITLTAGQAADLEYIGGGVSRWAVFKRN